MYIMLFTSPKNSVWEKVGRNMWKKIFLFGYNGDIVHLSNLNSHKIPVR